MVWLSSYIADNQTWHTYNVGMSACFYNNPKCFNRKYQMNNTVVVGMWACRHISHPLHSLSTYLIYLIERVGDSVIPSKINYLIFKWNIGYYRYAGMSACRHDLTPLLYWWKPNMTYIWCRHVGMSSWFLTTPKFLFENIKWWILSVSICPYVGKLL